MFRVYHYVGNEARTYYCARYLDKGDQFIMQDVLGYICDDKVIIAWSRGEIAVKQVDRFDPDDEIMLSHMVTSGDIRL